MLDKLRQSWQALKKGTPGRRFQEYHERRRSSGRSPAAAGASMAAGLALIAAGAVMLAVPGPGLLAMVVGAGLFSRESATAARVLDRLELWLRAAFARVGERWNRASLAVRILLILCGLLVAGSAGVGVCTVLFGG